MDGLSPEPAAIFIWTTIPGRTEWRYSFISPKLIAQDSGQFCQNLYLACESIGAGTCAVAGYDQARVGVDGRDEFNVYLAPVGKVYHGQRHHFQERNQLQLAGLGTQIFLTVGGSDGY